MSGYSNSSYSIGGAENELAQPVDTRLEYLHECAPPPVDTENPGRRRWYCPECGTMWWFVRTLVGRRMQGKWRPGARAGEPSRVQPKITEEAARELWEAMGEGPNYSPSWSEIVERAVALRVRCQELEEEHG